MYNGIINVNKEKGFTSFDVVAKLRGIVGQKKIGHTGTLDPDATGVLPVCLGNATKVCELLTDKDKAYEAVVRFGITTDTQDISGTVIERRPVTASIEQVREAVFSFVGEYDQIPPMFSAKKINGKHLYELARAGKVVERKPCRVKILKIDILKEDDFEAQKEISLSIECSKGTYIRTLCQDIGEKLGCGAVMTELKRVKSSCFEIADSYTLSEIQRLKAEDNLEKIIMSVDKVFLDYEELIFKDEIIRQIKNGNKISCDLLETGIKNNTYRIYDEKGVFYAIYEKKESESFIRPVKMFLP